jgi:hypothetical protein
MSNDPIVTRILDVSEATQVIQRSKGKHLFLACSQMAHANDKPGYGYTVSSNICVSKKIALKYVNDAYSATIRGKAQIRIAECSTCLFIGSIL